MNGGDNEGRFNCFASVGFNEVPNFEGTPCPSGQCDSSVCCVSISHTQSEADARLWSVGPKKRNMLHLTVLNVVSHYPLFFMGVRLIAVCERTRLSAGMIPKENSCDHTLAPSPGRLPLSAPLFRAAIIYSLFASSFQRRRATTLTATRTRRAAMDPMGGS